MRGKKKNNRLNYHVENELHAFEDSMIFMNEIFGLC